MLIRLDCGGQGDVREVVSYLAAREIMRTTKALAFLRSGVEVMKHKFYVVNGVHSNIRSIMSITKTGVHDYWCAIRHVWTLYTHELRGRDEGKRGRKHQSEHLI